VPSPVLRIRKDHVAFRNFDDPRHAGGEVPFDVAVEEPAAGVVGFPRGRREQAFGLRSSLDAIVRWCGFAATTGYCR